MRRALLRLSVAVLLASLPSALGVLGAIVLTPAGERFLGRLVADELSGHFTGRFSIQRISGPLRRTMTLEDVRIQDSTGLPFASFERLRLRYDAARLLAGQFVFEDVELESPDIRLVAMPGGRLNFHRIFRLGQGGRSGGRPPLIEFRNVSITNGRLDLWLNWNPPDTARRTAAGVATALAADRARPGRVILETTDGYRRVVALDSLSLHLDRLLVSSPNGDPLSFDLRSLSTRVSDPAVRIMDLQADGWTRRDTLALTIQHGQLPATQVSGGGFITWPKGPLRYDLELVAPTLDLADLRWISPDFPDMRGSSRITLRTRSDTETAYRLRGLRIGGPLGRIGGDVTVLTDNRRGIGVEEMTLEVEDLDFDVPRPYLDTIPFQGTLTGTLIGHGYPAALTLDADVVMKDRGADGATSRLRALGLVRLGGPTGAVFDTMMLAGTDLDLATVRKISPAVALNGRLVLDGVLRGSWRAVEFDGAIRHRDGTHPESVTEGLSFLDTRTDTTRFRTDVVVSPLAFDGVRPSYPGITLEGTVDGRIALEGTANRFRFLLSVEGTPGRLEGSGALDIGPGRIAAESLAVEFRQLDLASLGLGGPRTTLSGRMALDGSWDSLAGPDGKAMLALGRGWIESVPVDTASVEAEAVDGTLQLDSVLVLWPGGGAAGGSGRLGWRDDTGEAIRLAVVDDSLLVWDSLLTLLTSPPTDSADQARPLRGSMTGAIQVGGAGRSPHFSSWFRVRGVTWRGLGAERLDLGLGWKGLERPEVGFSVQADSLFVGTWTADEALLSGGGLVDSLRWIASASIGENSRVAAGGTRRIDSTAAVVVLDSLTFTLPRREWALLAPVSFQSGDGTIDISPLDLVAGDGAGHIRVSGSVPRAGTGALEASVLGLDLRDVYTLMERDTNSIAGTVQLDLTLAGTGANPEIWAVGSVADLLIGELSSPFVHGVMDYRSQRLDANLLLWKTGRPVLRIGADLPLNLALRGVPRRRLPGPLSLRITADSTELAFLQAFSRNLRRVRGRLNADLEVGGTWDEPRLGGRLAVRNGAATVPGLGVRYQDLQAGLHLNGDSVVIDSLRVASGPGSLRVGGSVRLENLARPILNLRFEPREFRVIDTRRFLKLDATGRLDLTGPLLNARLTGQVTADLAELHFADLLTKRIVDLENPGDSGLIDLDVVRAQRLGADFESRFLDSLRIDTLSVRMGQSVWLRSNEANIQLDGAIAVDKRHDQYRLDGELSALRGKYTLWIAGVVTRDFTVERGTVRYFGTPDLNAELDIEASHDVVEVETGEEIEVIARITGTLLQPKLELTTPPSSHTAPLSQTELVSYLMFGRPTFSQQGTGTASQQGSQYYAVQVGLSYLSSALTSEVQRALVSDLGVPIDYLDIRPGGAGATTAAGTGASAQVAIISAGWHLGDRWFVTIVADLCTNQQRFYPNVEFRISRELRLKTSVEPTYSCQVAVNQPTLTGDKYQVGLDMLWKRDY